MRRVLAGATLVWLALLAFALQASGDARYTAVQCYPGVNDGGDSSATYSESSRAGREAFCYGDGLGIYLPSRSAEGRFGQWTISAPEGTHFSYVSLSNRRGADEGWRPRTVAIGTDDSPTYIKGWRDGAWHDGWTLGSFKAVSAKLTCRPHITTKFGGGPASRRLCDPSWAAYVFAREFKFTVHDTTAPVISGIQGSLFSSGTKSGIQTGIVSVSDKGGGVQQLFLKVNGTRTATRSYNCDVVALRGSRVADELTPCPENRTEILAVNTSASPFRVGSNSVQVCASDYTDSADLGFPANVTCTAARTVNVSSSGTTPATPPPPPPPPPSPPPPSPPPPSPPPPSPPPPSSGIYGPYSASNQPGSSWRPYSGTSPWNTPLPAGIQPAANSQAIIDSWVTSGAQRFGVGTADSAGDWDHPLYYSRSSDPFYRVHCTEPWGSCDMEGQQIRIPAQARAAAGSDHHLTVIDQGTGWEYDFFNVQQKGGGTLTAAWGGRTRIDGDGRGGGSTAADFPLAAGVIRPSELAAGSINHALFMVVRCTNGTTVWPSGPGAGNQCGNKSNAPAMGQRFYLAMTSAQIDALNRPAWQEAVLRAFARYGAYVGDTGGGFVKLESGSSWTSFGYQDPWVQLAQSLGMPRYGSEYSFDMSNAVDWRRYLKVAR